MTSSINGLRLLWPDSVKAGSSPSARIRKARVSGEAIFKTRIGIGLYMMDLRWARLRSSPTRSDTPRGEIPIEDMVRMKQRNPHKPDAKRRSVTFGLHYKNRNSILLTMPNDLLYFDAFARI